MKNRQKQLNKIKEKLVKLKTFDKNFEVEGSENHKYEFNATKTDEELSMFEEKYYIRLPLGYRMFLEQIGNGGAGAYYGFEPLVDGLNNELSKEFIHTEYWNEDVVDYDDNKWINGLIKISDIGCGIDLCLVVNGAEYGNIWVDDRINGNGIYPDPYFDQKEDERTSFLDWYEMWLDRELLLFEDEEMTLKKELMSLKNNKASFLRSIKTIQENQQITLDKARDLFFVLDVYTNEEKEKFRTSISIMMTEFKEVE